jgi:calpain-1
MLPKQNGYTTRINSKKLQIEPFNNQDYWKIKSECLAQRKLFEDPFFEPNNKAIFFNSNRSTSDSIIWRRPAEIIDWRQYPVFIYDRSSKDFNEGYFGNRWFANGCTALSSMPDLFSRVAPYDQVCSGTGYAGIFHFRFWVYDKWYDVVVDDRLPIYESDKRLVFCSNRRDNTEFWAPLLEKGILFLF